MIIVETFCYGCLFYFGLKGEKFMKIKKFVEEYTKRADQLKEQYLKDNLKITSYVPFLRKDAIAQVIVDRSTYKYENYTKEDGTIGLKKTDEIRINSITQYILFCRVLIENYTNLEIETNEFVEEYDALKECGLLDKLMVGSENVPPMIPISEISELRTLIDMKQKDEIFNRTEIHNYVTKQIERFSALANVISKPVMDIIAEKLENETGEETDNNNEKNDYLEVVK